VSKGDLISTVDQAITLQTLPPDLSPYKSHSHVWLRAEAFCTALLERGYSFDELVIKRLGTFKRSYRNDIESIAAITDDGNGQLELALNRDSIYDRLPEGLFHQPRGHGAAAPVSEMVKEYRRYREEEREARRFFQPLEQEIFRYSISVEEEERRLLWGLQSGVMSSSFATFWNLRDGLPNESVSVLLRIMPWAHLIKGDMELTATALELMLERPVTVEQHIHNDQVTEGNVFQLGEGELGVDTVTGNHFSDAGAVWTFTISDMKGSEISAFLNDAPYGKFLKQFVDIFMPLEIDAVFEYVLNTAVEEEADEAVLGYSFVL
jgi:hypothetical protein